MSNKRNRSLGQSLVMHDESVRHPFRSQMPQKALHIPAEKISVELLDSDQSAWKKEDAHLFLFSFVAFFTAFYLFIF